MARVLVPMADGVEEIEAVTSSMSSGVLGWRWSAQGSPGSPSPPPER